MSFSVIWVGLIVGVLSYLLVRRIRKRRRRSHHAPVPGGFYQLACVVNSSLGMSKGKVLSQFGHAIEGILDVMEEHPERRSMWRRSGHAKIALRGTQSDIDQIHYVVKAERLPFYRVHDAGKTQVPSGSCTCIIVGPASKEELASITGHLKLY